MPAIYTRDTWYGRYVSHPEISPVFSAFNADDVDGLSNELRQAFSFLRRHGNGRYSAGSLMKLLTAADRLDEATAGGFNVLASDVPMVATATVPYEYDEETEVKKGGTLACAIVLPDGRMMMAVNTNARRQKLGLALFHFVTGTGYVHGNPVVWIHQGNRDSAHFALAAGMQPREVNSRGAVAWSVDYIREEADDLATMDTGDWEVEEAMSISRRSGRRTPRRSVALEDMDVNLPPEFLNARPVTTHNRDSIRRYLIADPEPEPSYYSDDEREDVRF